MNADLFAILGPKLNRNAVMKARKNLIFLIVFNCNDLLTFCLIFKTWAKLFFSQ